MHSPWLQQAAELWHGRYQVGRVCSEHAKTGMVKFLSKDCTHRGCTKRSHYGVTGTKTAEFCSEHSKNSIVNVHRKGCTHLGCTTQPHYGVAGSSIRKFCARHTKKAMVRPTTSKNVCGVHSRADRGEGGGVGLDEGTIRSAGADGKRKGCFPSSTQGGTSAGRSRGGSKRTTHAPFPDTCDSGPTRNSLN